jgi:hypothetical protein
MQAVQRDRFYMNWDGCKTKWSWPVLTAAHSSMQVADLNNDAVADQGFVV